MFFDFPLQNSVWLLGSWQVRGRRHHPFYGKMTLWDVMILSFLQAVTSSAAILPRQGPDWATIQCPSDPDSDTILPTPSYGTEGASFMVCGQQLINAPAQLVYNAILDFKSYPAWNTFTVQVDLPSNVTSTPEDVYIGMPMTLHNSGVVPLINTADDLVVTVLDDDASGGYLLPAWRSNVSYFGVLLKSEHSNVVTSLDGGTTRYVSWQTFYDDVLDLDKVERLLRGNLQSGFEQQGVDLRAYVESLV